MSHSKKRKSVNPFLSMMSRKTRAQLSIETEMYQCPFPHCRTRKESPWALQGHWSRVGHPGIMSKIQPSARSQYVLDPDLKIESPAPSEVAPDKKKMNPHDQRKYAAIKPRHSFKNLPEGWTREKVARAYETAPLRGILKSTWLEKRAEKYDFPLCRWMVMRRVIS